MTARARPAPSALRPAPALHPAPAAGAPERRLLTGWGRTGASAARVTSPADAGEVLRLLAEAGRPGARGAIARGLGRSYGDAAQCAGGTVLTTQQLDVVGPIGDDGTVAVGGGTSLQRLMADALPRGWWVPVTPGTRQVTVGGAVAADVHGKNHHVDGSFCRHVASLTLATPVGVRHVDPGSDPDLFWATAGGMGLTGVVTEAVLRMAPVESSWMLVDTERFDDVGSAMATMAATDGGYRYSVAWVDAGSTKRGRTVLTQGHHAPRSSVPHGRPAHPALPAAPLLRVPVAPPRGLVGSATAAALAELWSRRARRRRCGQVVPLGAFFHPLDGVATWNLLYGPRGLVQYQYVVGHDAAEAVPETLNLLGRYRVPSPLAVLKRFGPGDPGPLSFPMPGWTLALDFPAGHPRLALLLGALDELVVGTGGRVYLAKDSRLARPLLRDMYPRLGELAAVRRAVDPDGVLRSDLAGRLGLYGDGQP